MLRFVTALCVSKALPVLLVWKPRLGVFSLASPRTNFLVREVGASLTDRPSTVKTFLLVAVHFRIGFVSVRCLEDRFVAELLTIFVHCTLQYFRCVVVLISHRFLRILPFERHRNADLEP
jgi:hypothetical protein